MYAIEQFFVEKGVELPISEAVVVLERAAAAMPGIHRMSSNATVKRAPLPFYDATLRFDGKQFVSDTSGYLVKTALKDNTNPRQPEFIAFVDGPRGLSPFDLTSKGLRSINNAMCLSLHREHAAAYVEFFTAVTMPVSSTWSVIINQKALRSLVGVDWFSDEAPDLFTGVVPPYLAEMRTIYDKIGVVQGIFYVVACLMVVGRRLGRYNFVVRGDGRIESIDAIQDVASELPRAFDELKDNAYPNDVRTSQGTYRRLLASEPVRFGGEWMYLNVDEKNMIIEQFLHPSGLVTENDGSFVGLIFRVKELPFGDGIQLLQITATTPLQDQNAGRYILLDVGGRRAIEAKGALNSSHPYLQEDVSEPLNLAIHANCVAEYLDFLHWFRRMSGSLQIHLLRTAADLTVNKEAAAALEKEKLEFVQQIAIKITEEGRQLPAAQDIGQEANAPEPSSEASIGPALVCEYWTQFNSSIILQRTTISRKGEIIKTEVLDNLSWSSP